MTIYDKGCISNYRNCSLCCFSNVLYRMLTYYRHTMEGLDDMPAHAKSSLFGVSLTIPITNGRLNLGTWQGIYLCEFRDYGGERWIVATIYE